ncbi:MAG: type I restriction enzyme R subunit [Akkermansiaceae bacterium]|jgi:type I restriction enzyme R subunit
MPHNEDTRVRISALCHLTRLGYTSLSLKNLSGDQDTNIAT